MKDDIVIVSATRTPVGSFNGAFANLPAHELGKIAIKAAIDRAGVEGSRVTVKYGFSGRILLGPRGHAGVVRLPVSVSVRDPKRAPIGADRTTVEASVTIDNPIAYFSQVRTVTFDVPEGSRAGDIDVFVGFEQTAPGAG